MHMQNLEDGNAKSYRMAKQKFRPARLGGFSGVKAYTEKVKILKKRRNAAGRTFCDAIRKSLPLRPKNGKTPNASSIINGSIQRRKLL